MILILGGAWQGKLTWAASHGMVGPVFDLKDGWPEAPVRCCRHLEALTRAASDRGETAQQVLDRLLPLTRDAFVISREIGSERHHRIFQGIVPTMSNIYVHFSQISFPVRYLVVNFQLESHSLRFREVINIISRNL